MDSMVKRKVVLSALVAFLLLYRKTKMHLVLQMDITFPVKLIGLFILKAHFKNPLPFSLSKNGNNYFRAFLARMQNVMCCGSLRKRCGSFCGSYKNIVILSWVAEGCGRVFAEAIFLEKTVLFQYI